MHTPLADSGGLPGIGRAGRALALGEPVVVPNPAPMTYSIVATRANSINAIKGRPRHQKVAVSMHNREQWHRVARGVDYGPLLLDAVVELMAQRFTVLMPLRATPAAPPWIMPAVQNGWLAAFNGYWNPTSQIWDRFPRLYGSSANLTGRPPAESAAHAARVFGRECVIVNGDALDRPGPRSPSTMVRVDHRGDLVLHRPGAQVAASGLEPAEFLRQLADSVGLPYTAHDLRSRREHGLGNEAERKESGK